MSTHTPSDRPALMDIRTIVSQVVGRTRSLFQDDVDAHDAAIRQCIAGRRILVTGAAGSIGSATVRQLLRYRPSLLAAIDLSENNMVELVRDVRSQTDLNVGDSLQTHIVDFGSPQGEQFVQQTAPFDLVLHFAAMKHVRSERDAFSLSRLVETNVLSVDRFLAAIKRHSPCDVFAISSDKACQPANLMGASKKLMEEVVFWHADHAGSILGGGDAPPLPRTACTRFANVAFSDGSLLAGYFFRIRKQQPLAGPSDVRRYFITEEEAGQLCLMAAALAQNRQILVPKMDPAADLKGFQTIAEIVLRAHGYTPRWYSSDEEARRSVSKDIAQGCYPCCFLGSDTSGEKDVEEFVAVDETLAPSPFKAIDVIGESPAVAGDVLLDTLRRLHGEVQRVDPRDAKRRIIDLFTRAVPAMHHHETGRNLDQKM